MTLEKLHKLIRLLPDGPTLLNGLNIANDLRKKKERERDRGGGCPECAALMLQSEEKLGHIRDDLRDAVSEGHSLNLESMMEKVFWGNSRLSPLDILIVIKVIRSGKITMPDLASILNSSWAEYREDEDEIYYSRDKHSALTKAVTRCVDRDWITRCKVDGRYELTVSFRQLEKLSKRPLTHSRERV